MCVYSSIHYTQKCKIRKKKFNNINNEKPKKSCLETALNKNFYSLSMNSAEVYAWILINLFAFAERLYILTVLEVEFIFTFDSDGRLSVRKQ